MFMKIIYRRATRDDAEKMLAHLSAVGSETDNLTFDEKTFAISPEKEARFINRFATDSSSIMLVAIDEDKGLIVGNGIIEGSKIARLSHRAELSVTVLKDYWGQGIGSELLKELIAFSKSAGHEVITLYVRSDNTRALSLYGKFGFTVIGISPRFFKIKGKYYSAHMMELDLSDQR